MEQLIIKSWKLLKTTSFGRWIFSRLIGLFVPYSGSVSPRVLEIENGKAVLELHDRWFVRNHLKSVHAIALANIAELASGLAMVSKLPKNARGIVKGLSIEYYKKARGTLTVRGLAELPDVINEDIEQLVFAEIFDDKAELVAKMQVTWQIGPRKDAK